VISNGKRRAPAIVLLLMILLLSLGLAACGGGGSSSSSDASTTGEATGESTGGSGGGKQEVPSATVGWVDATLEGSYQQRIHEAGEAAVEHVGWKMETTDTRGDPAAAARAVSSYVNSGVQAIIMSSITPATARAGLLQAKEKGIPVILVGGEVEGFPEPALDLNAYYGENEVELSEPLIELMTEELKPGDEVGILYTTLLKSGSARKEAVEEKLEENGIKVADALETEFDFQGGQANAATMLQQHPNLAAIVPVYDLWTAATVAAIKQAGAQGKVSVYSFYADAVNVPLMRKNPTIVKGLTDGNMIEAPLIAVEQLLQVLTGQEEEAEPDAAEGVFEYEAITQKNLPPGNQNGPVSLAEAEKPFFSQWDGEYEYP